MAHLARLRHSSCARTFHTSQNRSMRQDRRRGGGWWVGDQAHVTRDFHLFTRNEVHFHQVVDVKNLHSWNEMTFWAVTNEVHFGHLSQVMPAKPAQKKISASYFLVWFVDIPKHRENNYKHNHLTTHKKYCITDFTTVLVNPPFNSLGRKLSSAQILRKTTRGRSLCFLCSVPDTHTQKQKQKWLRRMNSGKEGSEAYFLSCVHPMHVHVFFNARK